MAQFRNILPGDPAPNFVQRSYANPEFNFDTAAGRYLVLCFFLSSNDPHSAKAVAAVKSRRDLFDDDFASFFGVTIDPLDAQQDRVKDTYPGYRFFFDLDFSVSKLYGATDIDLNKPPTDADIRRIWVVMDPTMRIKKVIPFRQDHGDCDELIAYMDSLPPPGLFAGIETYAPIIVLPNVFEPELCQELISLYETEGSVETGFMVERDGKTVGVIDGKQKRRRDHNIEDQALIQRLKERFSRRVMPEIAKVHQFHVTRMERYIIGCYSEEDGGHFRAHRDNTTRGTAHRRFAVSVNLNDDFDGGEVSFPEYGMRSYKAPAGGAVVFSCSLLHAVSKITRGRRYAFLPFLYDEEAASIREENKQYLGGGGIGDEKMPAPKTDAETSEPVETEKAS